jgi:hypothetical protein
MITGKQFSDMALAFPGTETIPHFDRTGFKLQGKRMFTTYLEKDNTANIFLSPSEQSVFCKIDPAHIYPVPNKWGEKGATTFDLNGVDADILREALICAYDAVMQSGKKRK